MRIFCLTPWFPAQPGAQSGNFILDSLLAMKAQGHEIATLVCQPWHPAWGGLLHQDWGRPALEPDLHDPDLHVRALRFPSIPRNFCRRLSLWLFKRRVLGPLQRQLAQWQPQVLLAHTEQMAVAATLAARPLGIPVLLVVHGVNTSPRLNTAAEKARTRALLQAVDRVILVGQPLWEPFAALAGSTDKFRIVHNGMQLPPGGSVREPGLQQRPLRFISVCNLQEGKGVDLNLEALARITGEGLLDWSYTIVGGGSSEPALRQAVQRLGIGDKVQFTGALAHTAVYGELAKADVFLLPSWQEAFGVAWLEAMACGLLAVAVAGQGPAAFIRHDDTGLLVAPRDVDSLAECLRRCFADTGFLREVAQRGKTLVQRDFTWAAHAQRLSQVCSEVVVRP